VRLWLLIALVHADLVTAVLPFASAVTAGATPDAAAGAGYSFINNFLLQSLGNLVLSDVGNQLLANATGALGGGETGQDGQPLNAVDALIGLVAPGGSDSAGATGPAFGPSQPQRSASGVSLPPGATQACLSTPVPLRISFVAHGVSC
jgi:hypothetical protein